MGAKYLADNINSLAPDGRLVVIGMQGGVKAELNLGALLSKGDRRGDIPAGRSEASKAAICEAVEREVWPMFASGQIKPVVTPCYRSTKRPRRIGCWPNPGPSARSSLQVAPTERT